MIPRTHKASRKDVITGKSVTLFLHYTWYARRSFLYSLFRSQQCRSSRRWYLIPIFLRRVTLLYSSSISSFIICFTMLICFIQLSRQRHGIRVLYLSTMYILNTGLRRAVLLNWYKSLERFKRPLPCIQIAKEPS